MTETRTLSPQTKLVFFTGALRELDQLTALMDDVYFEAGIEPPGHLACYISGRSEELTAHISRLRAEINPPAG
ncbi:hypothetical protein [Desulfuromonas thiophila]|uniref:Uncharacterized protein n=1 Tax=Desulfuromonas thiophila TaxID=57664 RepID=A0A1G6XVW6_9BACT|nr:hypothetical protein [Desulfuromonas thiophila]SDD81516.1 hypothetical protein SAMN05661003_101393 [Desulfuromonas thiophila]